MKSNELRINNLIGIEENALHSDGSNYSTLIFEIEEIKKDVVLFKGFHAGEFYKHLKPIPLTEEWLIKLGFVELFRSNIQSIFLLDGLYYYFHYDINKQEVRVIGFSISCDHVHQLQNLYFALTNTELKLKQ